MRIAVVGAGMCGLAAAWRLNKNAHDVTVYEAGNAVGGRAATRRIHGCAVDNGAQYFKLPDEAAAVRSLVLDDLPRDGLFDIARPVWTFDRDGTIAPGDPQENAEPKWTYQAGLDTLGQRLAAALTVRPGAGVAEVQRDGSGYVLRDGAGTLLGEAERVVIALPAPRTVDLIRASEIEPRRRAAVLAELAKVRYRSLLSVVLAYALVPGDTIFAGSTAREPRPYYALVNTDRSHDLSWLAFENDKGPSRVPEGLIVLVAQMGASFSAAHFTDGASEIAMQAASAASTLLEVDLHRPEWYDVARWPQALPDTTCSLETLNVDHGGLLCAGDYVAGGRVHLALQAGLDVAAL